MKAKRAAYYPLYRDAEIIYIRPPRNVSILVDEVQGGVITIAIDGPDMNGLGKSGFEVDLNPDDARELAARLLQAADASSVSEPLEDVTFQGTLSTP